MTTKTKLDEFTLAYIEAMLWSSTDHNGRPLDADYGPDDFAPKTLERIVEECAAFQASPGVSTMIGDGASAGHDFWLTRNGHGAGFWDGGWPEPDATVLTDLSKQFGEVHVYVGDDGKLYLE